MKSLIKKGTYRHYKGKDYQVLGTARHTETEEDLVLYFPLYGNQEDNCYWVRPLTMFTETVEIDDICKPRFALIAESSEIQNDPADN